MFVFWLALNAYSLFHGSVSTQTTIYCTEAGICSTSGWFHGLFVSRSTLPSCGLRMKARSITTVGGKLDVGEMFTIFLGVPRLFFLVISLKAYLFQIISFVSILWKFCWFPSLPWHDRSTSNEKIHSFEFEFLYFHLVSSFIFQFQCEISLRKALLMSLWKLRRNSCPV